MNITVKDFRNSPLYVFWSRYKKLLIAAGLIIALFIAGEIVLDNFLGLNQFLQTCKLASYIALFGLCQMIVIAAGGSGLDLSVGYTATLTAVLTAGIMDGKNENLLPAVLVALAIGLAVGVVNGLLSAMLKLPALVVTMAMANIVQGVINVYTAGADITGTPSPVLKVIAAGSIDIQAGPEVIQFPNVLFLLIVVTAVVLVLLYKTRWGLKLFGAGTNETTAYLSGVNVKKVRLVAFILSGAIAGFMGLMLLGNMGTAFKDMGSNYVMPSIAAVVVGGVALEGGDGNYFGVILGAIFLQTLTNLLIALGYGDAGKWMIYGIVLYILLAIYVRNKRSR